MEKQNELLNVFQKQIKSINILKKQKVYAKASKFLDITEGELKKVLDWEFWFLSVTFIWCLKGKPDIKNEISDNIFHY